MINVPPQAADDSVTVLEDESITVDVLANDSNPGGAAPTIDSVGSANNGMVEIVDGKIVYTPDENFNGDDSFTYTIVDDFGVTDEATVGVTVTAVNDDPLPGTTEISSTRTRVCGFRCWQRHRRRRTTRCRSRHRRGCLERDRSIEGNEIEYTPIPTSSGTTPSLTLSATAMAGATPRGSTSRSTRPMSTRWAERHGDRGRRRFGQHRRAGQRYRWRRRRSVDRQFHPASNGSVTQTGDTLVYTPDANFNGTTASRIRWMMARAARTSPPSMSR